MLSFNSAKLAELKAREALDTNRQRVLLVDDERANREMMAALLERDYELLQAADGQQAWDMLEAMDDPSLACIVSDQRMPRMTGVQLFERVASKMPDVVRVIVTGFIDVEAIIDAINTAGIYKFIVKPFDPSDFSLTVRRAVESYAMRRELDEYRAQLEEKVRERTRELHEANGALEEMSLTDPLTGLRNRRFLVQHLEADVALAQRGDVDLLFFLVDIDHFKAVNDSYGHCAGDRVLVQMRERLLEVFRESDYLVRWGGEEFLIVARGSKRCDASEIAQRIRTAVSARAFELDDGTLLHKTVSVGFAAYPFVQAAPDALNWSRVVDLADYALYMAKRNGRDAWFGVTANGATDAAALAERLTASIAEAVRQGPCDVLCSSASHTGAL